MKTVEIINLKDNEDEKEEKGVKNCERSDFYVQEFFEMFTMRQWF